MLAELRRSLLRRWLVAFLAFSLLLVSLGLPQKLGDLDEDGLPTALDLVRLINHLTRSVQEL